MEAMEAIERSYKVSRWTQGTLRVLKSLDKSSTLILAKMVSHYNALLASSDQLPYSATTLNLHNLLLHSHLLSFDGECDKLAKRVERALAILERDARRVNGEDLIITDSTIASTEAQGDTTMRTTSTVIPAIPPISLSLLDPTIPQPLSAEPITLDFSNLIPTSNATNSKAKGTAVAGDLISGDARPDGMDTGADINLDGMMGDSELEALLNSLGP